MRRQIQNMNFCNKTLKQEFCLTSGGIHDRLTRSSPFRKNPCLLTQFKELSKAFQEIVIAYQDFEELSESNPELFHLIEVLAKTSKKDIETLQTYLASRYLPRDLPLENRRQLIQLGNQQDALYNMSKEQQFDLCALILNQYQWDFLLSIQEVSQVTLNLLDWAFEASPEEIKPSLSFLERIYAGIEKKVKDDTENFPNLNEKIREDESLSKMTIDFARELHREWPSLHLYDGEHLLAKIHSVESLSIEHLIYVYQQLRMLIQADDTLFCLLLQAVSQEGKNGFQSAIEAGVMKLLGEKSEYFLPILSNSDITIVKKDANEIEIRYVFEQVILRKGEVQHPFEKEKYMIITQPLKKEKEHWSSPEPKVKIAVKKRVV